jgi:hypothetical protein
MIRWLRYLRIAFSVTFGIACVLLVVLWMRSHSGLEAHVFRLSQSRRVAVVSEFGEFGIASKIGDANSLILPTEFENLLPTEFENRSAYSLAMPPEYRQPLYRRLFSRNRELYSWKVGVPYWLPITICATLAVTPWLTWRFSLRTLLVAVTLIGLILGTIIATTR